ncbi:hypothetical protein ACFX2J_014199 [Malus domestica]
MSLPKGLQLHSHVLKSGLQTIPLISHHLINFYSKNQLPFILAKFFKKPHISHPPLGAQSSPPLPRTSF